VLSPSPPSRREREYLRWNTGGYRFGGNRQVEDFFRHGKMATIAITIAVTMLQWSHV